MTNKKIKILAISDDIRLKTGVGIQCKKILTGLVKTGKYDIVEMGGSLQVTKPDTVDGVKIYPTESYGNPYHVSQVMAVEKPDIVFAFSDPRFFQYLFAMDDEIRAYSKLVFYHTWDNDPFPKFNLPFYEACDGIVMISEFSYKLMSSNGVKCDHIPHMQDPKEFYPLPDQEVADERKKLANLVGKQDVDFIIFFNGRNLDRKRPGDLINIFNKFYETHPNSLFLLNTKMIDIEGTNLYQLQEDFLEGSIPIVFNYSGVDTALLNKFYNVADVTINIPYNEGFGLCVSESLLAGTPVIASKTGGMPEQMSRVAHYEAVETETVCRPHCAETEVYGILIPPAVRNLFGVIDQAYIYKDFVSDEQVLHALDMAYQLKQANELKALGLKGRQHVIDKYNEATLIEQWDNYFTKIYEAPSTFSKCKVVKI